MTFNEDSAARWIQLINVLLISLLPSIVQGYLVSIRPVRLAHMSGSLSAAIKSLGELLLTHLKPLGIVAKSGITQLSVNGS